MAPCWQGGRGGRGATMGARGERGGRLLGHTMDPSKLAAIALLLVSSVRAFQAPRPATFGPRDSQGSHVIFCPAAAGFGLLPASYTLPPTVDMFQGRHARLRLPLLARRRSGSSSPWIRLLAAVQAGDDRGSQTLISVMNFALETTVTSCTSQTCKALAFEGKVSQDFDPLVPSVDPPPGDLCASQRPHRFEVREVPVDYDDLCSAEDREAARAVFASTCELSCWRKDRSDRMKATPDEKAGQDWETYPGERIARQSTTIGRKMIIGAVDVSRHEFELRLVQEWDRSK
eukprot:767688-Hanusia_phi.AAC.13